jgi:precorrin-6x reductase
MSRSSIGETPMTGAERQARYRAAHADGVPVIRIRRPADRRSRIQRWNDTIAALMNLQKEYSTAGQSAG